MQLKHSSLIFIIAITAGFSCKQRMEKSDQKVANGFNAPDSVYNNPVQMLVDPATGEGFCTLGFVNDTTAFTAVHCVYDGQGINRTKVGLRRKNNTIVAASNIFVHPNAVQKYAVIVGIEKEMSAVYQAMYQADRSCSNPPPQLVSKLEQLTAAHNRNYDEFSKYDFAILVFPPNTGSQYVSNNQYFKLTTRAEKLQNVSGVKHIGFGANGLGRTFRPKDSCEEGPTGEGYGIRRMGINENLTITQDGALFKTKGNTQFPRRNAMILFGDSGSVWVACYGGSCDTLDALAISNSISLGSLGFGEGVGVNLYSNASKDTMKLAVNCSNQPCAQKWEGFDEIVNGVSSSGSNGNALLDLAKADIRINAQLISNQYVFSISLPRDFMAMSVYACANDNDTACVLNENSRVKLSPVMKNDRIIYDRILTIEKNQNRNVQKYLTIRLVDPQQLNRTKTRKVKVNVN